MKKGFKSAGLLLAAAMMLVGGLSGAAVASDVISMTGSTTVLPVAQKTAEVFMKINPDVKLSVGGTGSGDGIKAIIEGTVQIGNASRGLKKKEIKLAAEKGVKLVRHTVALDCIVPVVNPSNPISNLTMAQLKDIYSGKVKNWKDVGGKDKPMVVISRDSSSGTFGVWKKLVLKKGRVRPDAQLQASNGAVAQAVAGNKYAIGYVGIGYLNKDLKGLTVNGVKASAATAASGKYPISRALYMFTAGDPKGKVKAYLDFVKSDKGQQIVEEEGFVKVK